MKKCGHCFESDGIVECEAPENDAGHKFLCVCTRCGYTAWPDAGDSHGGDQISMLSASGADACWPLSEGAPKKCAKCFGSDDIVKCNAPDSDHGHQDLHICTRCGHAHWPDAE
jgi:hypothetical protein